MIPEYFEFSCPVRILSGRKAVSNLPYELSQRGAKHPMVVTDKGVVAARLLRPVEAAFADSDISICHVFDETPPDSSSRLINKVAKIFMEKGCDSFVALGGGSVLDTAKGINMLVSEGVTNLLQLQGLDRITRPMHPFIAIPTTAGTGSEVTSVAVAYDEESGTKLAFVSHRLFPDVAIIDPSVMFTMPPRITAATGLDALTHAIEACYSLQKNPVSDAFAASAIRLIHEYLVRAVEDGRDEEARTAMGTAATLAGIAFNNAMVGVVHALAHACGGVAHVPHGVANGIFLPHGMEYNLEKASDNIAEVAYYLGDFTPYASSRERALKAIETVRTLRLRLRDLCGSQVRLQEAGVRRDQLEEIARAAINDGSVTYNPDDLTYGDALKLLEKAY